MSETVTANAQMSMPGIGTLALDGFRGQVGRRAGLSEQGHFGGGGVVDDSEVQDSHVIPGTDHDVLGLDVAVHQPGCVQVRQPAEDLHRDLRDPVVWQRLAVDEPPSVRPST